jgi:3-hydroxyisobutyrate dehydrogenase
MGMPMATRLAGAGFHVRGFDVDPALREAFAEGERAHAAESARAAASGADATILMLPGTPVVRAVLTGQDAVLEALAPGSLLIDMSSSEALATRELATQTGRAGARLVDAPVSGGVTGAEAGSLTIMAGGADADVDEARVALEVLGSTEHVGPVGAGHALKALNNLMSGISLLATSEAMLVAQRFGLDPEVVLGVVNRSSGRSWSTETKFPKFVLPATYDSGFTLELMLKDMTSAVALGSQLGAALPFSHAALEAWSRAAHDLPSGADHTEIARWVGYGEETPKHRSASGTAG